jgi:hypothetical protein
VAADTHQNVTKLPTSSVNTPKEKTHRNVSENCTYLDKIQMSRQFYDDDDDDYDDDHGIVDMTMVMLIIFLGR